MNSLRAIILDNIGDSADRIAAAIKQAGYAAKIVTVRSIEDLCGTLSRDSKEIVFCTFSGTDFNALEALDRIRSEGFHTPFIVISGSCEEDRSAVEAIRRGVTDFVMSEVIGSLVPAVERGFAQAVLLREKMRAEAALRESEERYRIVAETASDSIITIDTNSTIIYANRATETTFGYSRDELIGNSITLLMPDYAKSRHCKALGRYVETGVRQLDWNGIEVEAITKDGSELPIQISFGEYAGTSQRLFTAIIRDRSATKAAELALRRSEEYFRALVEATTQFVWKLDAKANLVEFPHWWEELTGQSAEESLKYGWMECVHPDERKFVRERYEWALEHSAAVELTLRLRTKDGTYHHYEARGVPIKDQDGAIVQWICALVDVTDKRHAENELRRSEANYRALIQATTQFVWTADETGFSPEMLEWFSKNSGTPVASVEDLIAIMHPVDERGARKEWGEALETKKVFQYICRFYRADGTLYYLAARAVPMFNADGTFDHWIGTFSDITERMVEQKALQQSEERFRDLFENANDLIYTHDLEGNFISLNRAGEIITGYTRSESERLNIKDVVAPEYLATAAEKISAKLEGVAPATSYETAIITKDGRKVVLDLSTRLIYENDRPVAVQGIARDITEKKAAETALRSSEKQLRIIADSIPVHITHVSADGTMRFANRAFLRWLGKSSAEVFGQQARDILGDTPYEQVLPEFKRVLKGEQFAVEREVFLDPHDQTGHEGKRFVRMDYVPEFDEEGNVQSFFAFMTDLTENKRAEHLLRKSEEQLRQSQKLESVGRLAGGIAHDFNNMLTAINGYSELTLRRMHVTDPLRHNIEEIRKAGERSAELTNQLLAFSRRQILQPRVLDLNRAVGDLVPMLERLIGAAIPLRTDFASDSGFVNADPGQLSQVLLNLVINSRDAMVDGGAIDIATRKAVITSDVAAAGSVMKPGTYSVMSITDSGVGMDPETVKHIFEPFFTTKDVGKGTGLGLSTVYGIVHQSGGNIVVKSSPGSGTTFEIYLPSVLTDHEAAIHDSDGKSRFAFGNETILLVEDEDTVRDLGREILESCGYSVITATDGAKGLELFRKRGGDISLLLTDVVMPNMGGRELAEEVKRIDPRLKVLFSSGYDDHSIVKDGTLSEGTNFIQKPYTFDSLALKVRDILDN